MNRQHRAWSKSSPSTASLREKILNDCVNNIRTKRNNAILERRIKDCTNPMELVDELISDSVKKQHESSDGNQSYDDYYNYVTDDIEFLNELEDAIKYELRDELEFKEEEQHYYEMDDTSDGVLCPVCKQTNLMVNSYFTAALCHCGAYFNYQACGSAINGNMDPEYLKCVYLGEIKDRIANMYDRHYNGCRLRSDISYASHDYLSFYCNDARLSCSCSYCGFCDSL